MLIASAIFTYYSTDTVLPTNFSLLVNTQFRVHSELLVQTYSSFLAYYIRFWLFLLVKYKIMMWTDGSDDV